jgi:hypothetical protein
VVTHEGEPRGAHLGEAARCFEPGLQPEPRGDDDAIAEPELAGVILRGGDEQRAGAALGRTGA